jgi:branched-chain amino acid transport system substrate-binding protein
VGFLAGLTGPGSELGLGARRALELSIAQVNAAGGVKGRSLALVSLDAGQLASDRDAFRRFDQPVTAVLGPLTTTVFTVGHDDGILRVTTRNEAFGETLGQYAVDRGLSDVAVLMEISNDASTRPTLEGFRTTVGPAGIRVRDPVEFDLRSHPDYAALALKLGTAKAYLILANGYDTAQIGQKLAQRGRMEPLLGPPWAMTAEVIAQGGRQVERMVFVSLYDAQSRAGAWRSVRDRYSRLYGEEPGVAAISASDALTLLVSAWKNAKSLSTEDLPEAVKTVGEVQGLQAPFRMDASGALVRDLFLSTVREGRFVRNSP